MKTVGLIFFSLKVGIINCPWLEGREEGDNRGNKGKGQVKGTCIKDTWTKTMGEGRIESGRWGWVGQGRIMGEKWRQL